MKEQRHVCILENICIRLYKFLSLSLIHYLSKNRTNHENTLLYKYIHQTQRKYLQDQGPRFTTEVHISEFVQPMTK